MMTTVIVTMQMITTTVMTTEEYDDDDQNEDSNVTSTQHQIRQSRQVTVKLTQTKTTMKTTTMMALTCSCKLYDQCRTGDRHGRTRNGSS